MGSNKMPDHVANDFRRMLGLSESDAIPADLEDNYVRYRHMKDVCSAGTVTPSELILLIMITIPTAESRVLRPGVKVTTVYKGKRVSGLFVEDPGGDEVHVKVDDMKYQKVLRQDTEVE